MHVLQLVNTVLGVIWSIKISLPALMHAPFSWWHWGASTNQKSMRNQCRQIFIGMALISVCVYTNIRKFNCLHGNVAVWLTTHTVKSEITIDKDDFIVLSCVQLAYSYIKAKCVELDLDHLLWARHFIIHIHLWDDAFWSILVFQVEYTALKLQASYISIGIPIECIKIYQ